MTATATMIKKLRRMVDELGESNGYDDDLLQEIIEQFPLIDENGEVPYTWDDATSPPTKDTNEDWVATYDLHSAAAEVWQEKAGKVSHQFMFSADGGQYQAHQQHDHCMQQSRFHLSRRAPKTIRMFMSPLPSTSRSYVRNDLEP